jgi:hypothetical protein
LLAGCAADERDLDVLQGTISSIGQGSTAAVDANSHTAHQVAEADGQTGPEQGVASKVRVGREHVGALDAGDLGGEDDGHDDTVDGDDLAEDDGDEVLGSDSGSLDACTEDGRSGNEDAPAGRTLLG